MRKSAVLFVTVLAFVLPIGWVAADPDRTTLGGDGKERLGRAAIVAYSANVHGFSMYRCKYRVTKAEANSISDAIEGKFVNARGYDNRLIVSGEKVLYEGFAPKPDPRNAVPAATPEKPGSSYIESPGSSNRYLTDGKREMDYVPGLESINLFSGEKEYGAIRETTPLGAGAPHRNLYGPDVMLRQPERYKVTWIGSEQIDGRPVISVRFDDNQVSKFREETWTFADVYSFDPARGYLPVRVIKLRNDTPTTHTITTQVRVCSQQRWFPERKLIVDLPSKPGAPCRVKELKLLELDPDSRPKDDEFSHSVPAGTYVFEFPNPGKYFRLKNEERILISDIPKLFDRLDKAPPPPQSESAIQEPLHYKWYGIGGGGMLVLLGVGLVFFRRWRFRREAA